MNADLELLEKGKNWVRWCSKFFGEISFKFSVNLTEFFCPKGGFLHHLLREREKRQFLKLPDIKLWRIVYYHAINCSIGANNWQYGGMHIFLYLSHRIIYSLRWKEKSSNLSLWYILRVEEDENIADLSPYYDKVSMKLVCVV